MSAHLPARPRLADHVLVRRYHDGAEELVVLHDIERRGLVRIGPREWTLLSCADGTRDLEGIVLAAARLGAHVRAPALRAFLEQLHAAGLIAGDADEGGSATGGAGAPSASGEGLATPADRPLDPLPGFLLTCDGTGSCCRIYASVLASAEETARARAALPHVLDGGSCPERAFTPERGSVAQGAYAIALVEGRCAYLEPGGRCGIHAAQGEAAKPLGCRVFPASFTDDGERVRVSVAVECACVLASVGRTDGAPLVPPEVRVRGDLDEAVYVEVLPDRIALTARASASRSELVAWSRAVLAGLDESGDRAVPERLWALARALEADGPSARAAKRALARPVALCPGELAPWLDALASTAAKRATEDAAWRSERDLARLATKWVEAASRTSIASMAAAAEGAGVEDARARPASEAFYVRALVHGHRVAARGRSLAASLRDRAIRVLVARAMSAAIARAPACGAGFEGAVDPACRHPLALVEAMLRGHGLGVYAAALDA